MEAASTPASDADAATLTPPATEAATTAEPEPVPVAGVAGASPAVATAEADGKAVDGEAVAPSTPTIPPRSDGDGGDNGGGTGGAAEAKAEGATSGGGGGGEASSEPSPLMAEPDSAAVAAKAAVPHLDLTSASESEKPSTKGGGAGDAVAAGVEAGGAAGTAGPVSSRSAKSARSRASHKSSGSSRSKPPATPNPRIDVSPRYMYPAGSIAPPLPAFYGGNIEGEIVLNAKGKPATMQLLRGKFVGLYFCKAPSEPCAEFTKLLTTVDAKIRVARPPSQPGFQIVVCPLHDDDVKFWAHHPELPPAWLTIPWADPRLRTLAARFKVQGCPSLVIVDPEGRCVCRDARLSVTTDTEGAEFPWGPRHPWRIVDEGTQLIRRDGSRLKVRELQDTNDVVGFYFGAKWVPPCEQFTQQLVNAYDTLKISKARAQMGNDDGRRFEVIYVPHERSLAEFEDSLEKMPWASLVFGDTRRLAQLTRRFCVRGLPALALVDVVTGRVINRDARPDLATDPRCLDFPWAVSPLAAIDEAAGARMNEHPCCIMLLDGATRAHGLKSFRNFNRAATEAFEDAPNGRALWDSRAAAAVRAKRAKEETVYLTETARLTSEHEAQLAELDAESKRARDAHDAEVEAIDKEENDVIGPDVAKKPAKSKRKKIAAEAHEKREAARARLDPILDDVARRRAVIREEYRKMMATRQAQFDTRFERRARERRLRVDKCLEHLPPLPDEEEPQLLFLVGDEDTDLAKPIRAFLQLNDVPPPNLVILDIPHQKKFIWRRPEGAEGADAEDSDISEPSDGDEAKAAAAGDGGDGGAGESKAGGGEGEGGSGGSRSGEDTARGSDYNEGAARTPRKGKGGRKADAKDGDGGKAETKSDDEDEDEDEEPEEGLTAKGGGVVPSEKDIRLFVRAYLANKLTPWNLMS